MAEQVHFVCPKCGCEEIAELSLYVVATPVTKWSASGEPEEYGDAEIDWEADFPYGILFDRKPVPELILQCMYCAAQFGKPDIEDYCDD